MIYIYIYYYNKISKFIIKYHYGLNLSMCNSGRPRDSKNTANRQHIPAMSRKPLDVVPDNFKTD